MKVNLEKSRMFCSKNVNHGRQNDFSSISGINRATNLGKYLSLKGESLKMVNSHLAPWKNKLLNKAGRLCLAKLVIALIPIYTMQVLWLAEAVCDQVDQMVLKCMRSIGGRNCN